MKLHLTKIYRTEKDKAGNLLKTKDGRAYVRISVKCSEHGDKWLSGFGAPWNDNWQEGQEVEVDVKENGEYLNFSKPDPMSELNRVIMRHEQEIGRLWETVKKLESRPDGIPVIHDDEPKIDDSELPF